MRRRLRGSTLLWDAEISGTIATGGDLRNTDFESGVSGYVIRDDGSAEFNELVARATLSASSIDIGGADADSFHVNIDGDMWVGAAAYAATVPFRVTRTGELHVGGDDATSFHIDAAGGIWSGAAIADKATAPFRVSSAGALVATSATLTGQLSTAPSGDARVVVGQSGSVSFVFLDHGEAATAQAYLAAEWTAGAPGYGTLVVKAPKQDASASPPSILLTHYASSTRQIEFRDIDKFYIDTLPTVTAVTANVYIDPATNELKRIV